MEEVKAHEANHGIPSAGPNSIHLRLLRQSFQQMSHVSPEHCSRILQQPPREWAQELLYQHILQELNGMVKIYHPDGSRRDLGRQDLAHVSWDNEQLDEVVVKHLEKVDAHRTNLSKYIVDHLQRIRATAQPAVKEEIFAAILQSAVHISNQDTAARKPPDSSDLMEALKLASTPELLTYFSKHSTSSPSTTAMPQLPLDDMPSFSEMANILSNVLVAQSLQLGEFSEPADAAKVKLYFCTLRSRYSRDTAWKVCDIMEKALRTGNEHKVLKVCMSVLQDIHERRAILDSNVLGILSAK